MEPENEVKGEPGALELQRHHVYYKKHEEGIGMLLRMQWDQVSSPMLW